MIAENRRFKGAVLAAALGVIALAAGEAHGVEAEALGTDGWKAADKMAERSGIDIHQVQELRSQGYGWGEVEAAMTISAASETDIDEIVALRKTGLGWGQIASRYDVKLGTLMRRGEAKAMRIKAPADEDELRDAVASANPPLEPKMTPAERIAERRVVELEEVRALRNKGYGWGEVEKAFAISAAAGVELDAVTARRDAGAGWGEIAREHNLNLGEVMRTRREPEKTGKPEMSEPREKAVPEPAGSSTRGAPSSKPSTARPEKSRGRGRR